MKKRREKKREPAIGDTILFTLSDNEDDPATPFGIADLTGKRADGYYEFAWRGNCSGIAHGVYRKVWVDSKEGRHYHRDRPLHSSHRRMTHLDTGPSWITRDRIIAHGFSFLDSGRPRNSLLKFVSDHEDVAWTHPDLLQGQ
jgi:hypothetical protein